MASVRQALAAATQYLASNGLESPREDSELIIASITRTDRTYLLTHPDKPLSRRQSVEMWRWLGKRARHYPIQYIRGNQEFYGRDFLVSPSVLIPRPETELLVDTCLELVSDVDVSAASALDVGTGSGCIAITLALEVQDLKVSATDLSAAAMTVAHFNAVSLGCSERVKMLVGDLVQPVRELGARFDVIVCNPPYVPTQERHLVAPSVLKYEPEEAVFAGGTGLEIYRRLLIEAPSVLKRNGHLVLELGAEQASTVESIAVDLGWERSGLKKDLAGIERCALFRRA